MNLLLLLSAMLSAITGVNVGGARVPVVAEQVAQVAATATARVAAAAVDRVGYRQFAGPVPRFVPLPLPLPRLTVATIPAYASRPRE